MDIDGHQRTVQLQGEKADSDREHWRTLQLPWEDKDLA